MNEVSKFNRYLKWWTWETSYEQNTRNHNFGELYANLGLQMTQQSVHIFSQSVTHLKEGTVLP